MCLHLCFRHSHSQQELQPLTKCTTNYSFSSNTETNQNLSPAVTYFAELTSEAASHVHVFQ